MKLQKATSFALLAVLDLAADPTRQPSATEIAAKYGISTHHLAKVLRELGRAGIVSSVRGVGGGCRFIGNPKRLTLMDIIVLFEPTGPDRAGRDEPHAGTTVGAALHRVLAEIDEHAVATFRSITLSTMLKLMRQPPAAGPGGEGGGR
jgi:Rrf2 family protein